jgi:hypothetical protein
MRLSTLLYIPTSCANGVGQKFRRVEVESLLIFLAVRHMMIEGDKPVGSFMRERKVNVFIWLCS